VKGRLSLTHSLVSVRFVAQSLQKPHGRRVLRHQPAEGTAGLVDEEFALVRLGKGGEEEDVSVDRIQGIAGLKFIVAGELVADFWDATSRAMPLQSAPTVYLLRADSSPLRFSAV
jgi:hypothetical protein